MAPSARLNDTTHMSERVIPRFKERPRFYFKEWRKYRGLTQEELAGRIESTASSISQLETGKQGFTDSTLVAIADALNCEPGDLLSANPYMSGEVVDLTARLRKASPDLQRQAISIVRALLDTGTSGRPALLPRDGDDDFSPEIGVDVGIPGGELSLRKSR